MSILVFTHELPDRMANRGLIDLRKYLSELCKDTIVITQDSGVFVSTAPEKTIILSLYDRLAHMGISDTIQLKEKEGSFCIRYLEKRGLLITAKTSQGLMYAVYSLLEHLGTGFYSHGDVLPQVSKKADFTDINIECEPTFSIRGLLNWPDFLCGCTAWGYEDFKNYFDQMAKMKMNFFGIHCYSQEPYLGFEYSGISHKGYLDTTMTNGWGWTPMKTSRYPFDTAQYYSSDEFGSPAAFHVENEIDKTNKTKAMMRKAFDYAKTIGIKTCVGFEPSELPWEIMAVIPDEAKINGKLNQRSNAAKDIMKARLEDIVNTYPEIDYIWLWENEGSAWMCHGAQEVTFDVSYLLFAYEYLKQIAPQIKLIIAGWGSVARLFKLMDEKLPKDIIFACLNHFLGCQVVDDVFGEIEGREMWPIPWLEDDASLYYPQFHLRRFKNDIERAERFRCAGFIGIHWRTKVIDHNISFMAQALWNRDLEVKDFALAEGRKQYSEEIGNKWAALLDQWDENKPFPHTICYPGYAAFPTNDAENVYTPGSNHVFHDYIEKIEKELFVLKELLDSANSKTDRERLLYWINYISQMLWTTKTLDNGGTIRELKEQLRSENLTKEQKDDAVVNILNMIKVNYECIANAILHQANTVSNKTELGQLASMNQKLYVQGFLREKNMLMEYKPELESQFKNLVDALVPAVAHDSRIIAYQMPSVLEAGEVWEIRATVIGEKPDTVMLLWKCSGEEEYVESSMEWIGRNTYGIQFAASKKSGTVMHLRIKAQSEYRELVWPNEGIGEYSVSVV